jgi:hypothetical protein
MGFAGTDIAAAQSISYEQNGRLQTYEFKPQQGEATTGGRLTAAKPNVRSNRPAALSRGSKNIPWDEPGKISGVPGVLENSATNLPARPARTSSRYTHKGTARAAQQTGSIGSGEPDKSARHESDTGPETSNWPHASQAAVEPHEGHVRAHGSAAESLQAESTKAPDAAAEARAEIIARFRAKALAEEQRRLDVEKNRDRHARPGEPSPAALGNAEQRHAQADPDYTGAITSAPRSSAARSGKSGLKDGVCRMFFFGLLPGC